MIQVANNIWIGDSHDEKSADLASLNIGAVLNVAHDLRATTGWDHGVEYMQVGLVDGPGNPISAYYAAVLALVALLDKHDRVMVCCHDGGRSLAVVLMYLGIGTYRRDRGIDGWVQLVRERVDEELPPIHSAHKTAFNNINWRALAAAAKGQ